MKKLRDYLPLHFVLFLILGIVVQFYTQFWHYGFIRLFILVASISLLLLFLKKRMMTSVLSFVIFFFVGVSSVYIHNDSHYNNFYKNYVSAKSFATFKVVKVLKSGFYNDKYVMEVVAIGNQKTRGNVLVNIRKDSTKTSLKVDENIHSKAHFKELVGPLNPHQFHYKSYLAKQGIYEQLFLHENQYRRIGFGNPSLKGLAAKSRNKIQKSLSTYHFTKDELGVISALLLGQRQDISKELLTDYQKAGAIHILAVSGLHVGVLLWLLSFLLQPIERLTYGKFLKAMFIVLLLWVFAFIAGLSASVVRAVTMFTFLAIGQSFQRKHVVTFSLISSMLFLLLIKPMFIFDVGFQLSYLAVFGIVWLQPKLYGVWKPTFKLVHFFWQLCTVSIAAQIVIFPISIYYFHQFPSLFLASNLVIIPCLMYILIGGVVLIFLALFQLLPQFFAEGYGFVISLMNHFVSFISKQEQFLFKEISLSIGMMLAWYVVIIFTTQFLIHKKAKNVIFFLSSIVLFQCVFLFEFTENNHQKEWIVFHKSRKSVIGKRIGKTLFLQHNLDTLQLKDDYSLKSYRISENIKEIHQTRFNNFMYFQDTNILLVDRLGIYKVKGLVKPIVVLQNSPKINLLRLVQHLEPIQIVADGSNYRSDIERWKLICTKQQVPFHYTGEKGAFIVKY